MVLSFSPGRTAGTKIVLMDVSPLEYLSRSFYCHNLNKQLKAIRIAVVVFVARQWPIIFWQRRKSVRPRVEGTADVVAAVAVVAADDADGHYRLFTVFYDGAAAGVCGRTLFVLVLLFS